MAETIQNAHIPIRSLPAMDIKAMPHGQRGQVLDSFLASLESIAATPCIQAQRQCRKEAPLQTSDSRRLQQRYERHVHCFVYLNRSLALPHTCLANVAHFDQGSQSQIIETMFLFLWQMDAVE